MLASRKANDEAVGGDEVGVAPAVPVRVGVGVPWVPPGVPVATRVPLGFGVGVTVSVGGVKLRGVTVGRGVRVGRPVDVGRGNAYAPVATTAISGRASTMTGRITAAMEHARLTLG